MNLSTVDRVLSRMAATGNARDEARSEVAALLATVSGAVERYLDRRATRTSRTVYFDVEPCGTIYSLDAYPVTVMTGAWFDPDQAFGTGFELAASDYFDPTLDTQGVFQTKGPLSRYARHPRALKITFTGGMANDTDSFVAAYPDIAGAVDTQVAHEWQRRNALGVTSVSYPDGTTATLSFDRWIPSVKQVLDYYRRVS